MKMVTKKNIKFYPITRLCKDDIIMAFEGVSDLKTIKQKVNLLTDLEMEGIARRLADDYCEQLYWSSLRAIVEHILKEKERKNG
jgi:hypothetical protein